MKEKTIKEALTVLVAVLLVGASAFALTACDNGGVKIKTYTVTVINGTGGGDYEQGEAVTITANTPPEGQQFKNWTTASEGFNFANADSVTTTFTMPPNAITVTANYEASQPTPQQLANTYKTGNATILAKTTATIVLGDESAVDSALTAYEALSSEAKALLTEEKTLLDNLKTKIEELKATATPQELAAAFKTTHAAILVKTTATIVLDDETAVDSALTAYDALSAEVKALLTEEKALLDNLKTKIEELKATATPQELANAFKTDHAAILAKTTTTIALDDETTVNAALTAYNALAQNIKALLTTEKALLDNLKSKIEELKSAGNTTVPGEVANFTAMPGNGQVVLTWTVPANNGGSAITGYEVTRDNWTSKVTKAANELTHTYTGLVNGTAYTFKVRALNAQGAGAESTKTATPPIISITSVAITIDAPITGAVPATTIGGIGNFTAGTVTWSPTDNPFEVNKIYTATVTLTANTGYTFTGLTTATINEQTVTSTNNTNIAVTLSLEFTQTIPVPYTYIITGSGTTFAATRGVATVGTANQPMSLSDFGKK